MVSLKGASGLSGFLLVDNRNFFIESSDYATLPSVIKGREGRLKIRLMKQGEEAQVSRLARRVFDECVSESCTKRGVREFKEHSTISHLRKRKKEGGLFFVAEVIDKIVGVIGIRNDEHISFFFVDARYQGMGVGSKLLKRAIKACLKHRSNLSALTVKSSLYAEGIYKRWGFRKTGPKQMKHGIRFVPMRLKLGGDRSSALAP